MRLVCPNCNAQYEVDDAAIPDSGRDVQCSNCGHGWFQPGSAAPETDVIHAGAGAPAAAIAGPEPDSEPEGFGPDPDVPEEEFLPDFDPDDAADTAFSFGPEPDFGPGEDAPFWADEIVGFDAGDAPADPKPDPASDMPDETGNTIATMQAGDEDVTPAPTPGTTPRRPLDAALLAVLREEAEREAAQRRAEGSAGFEAQDELNLEEPEANRGVEAAAAAATAAMARRRAGLPDLSDANGPAAPPDEGDKPYTGRHGEEPDQPGHGCERLPDINEINATLTATTDRAGEPVAEVSPEMTARRRSGFGQGFGFIIALAVLGAVLYVFAPALAERVPALTPALSVYVAAVDSARIWLNGLLESAANSMRPGADG